MDKKKRKDNCNDKEKQNYGLGDLKQNYKIGIKYYEEIEKDSKGKNE